MIKIKSTNRPVEEKDLERLAQVVGRPIPPQYRTFLLAYNGGRPTPDTIDVQGAPFGATNVGDFYGFYGVDDEMNCYDLLRNWEELPGCKENMILPIANDGYGYTIGLLLDEEDYGHVYYYDAKELPPTPYFLAKDFNEFLGLIRGPNAEEQAYYDSLDPVVYTKYRFVEMRNSGRTLTDADIKKLETHLGQPLHGSYKEFLMEFNGGFPSPDRLDIDGAPFPARVIKVLFSYDAEDPSRDLLHHWETIPHVKDWQWLPIGIDRENCLLMLDLSPEKYGQILYYDGDSEEEPHPTYWVAKGFATFMDKLRGLNCKEMGLPDLVDIPVRFSGSRPRDALRGNAIAGFANTPRGHVWHRHQDGETLQLVPKDVHKKTGDPKGYGLRWRSS